MNLVAKEGNWFSALIILVCGFLAGLVLALGPLFDSWENTCDPGICVAEVRGEGVYIMDDSVTLPVTVLRPVKIRGAVHKEDGDMEEWDVIVHPGALVVPRRAWQNGE